LRDFPIPSGSYRRLTPRAVASGYTGAVKVAILLFAMSLGAVAQRPPFTVEDLKIWVVPSDPRIRPDGKWVVWCEQFTLWVGLSDGRERRKLGEGASPRWSPDGERIAWISNGALRVRKLEGGPEIEIQTPGSPLAFAWSAEGDRIAFTARPPAPAAGPGWAPPSILPRLRRDPPPQLFVVPSAGGPARQVGSGCAGEPTWPLDGKSVIAVCDGQISASGKALTKEAGRYESPIVSPDGNRIAYLFTERQQRKLFVMNADGTRARPLSGSLDRDATSPQWSSDSRTVYFLADDRGSTHVYAARNDGTIRQVTSKPERLHGFSLADNGRAVSVRSAATDGGSVVTFTVDVPSQPVTLSDPNGKLLAEREIAAVEELEFESAGHRVQAWLVKPGGSGKYPLIVDVADDPRRMRGVEFSLRAQILAAKGFSVLLANPRGTPGYGEQFANLLPTSNPGDDFDDLMRGVDAAVAKGIVDPQRISIVGGITAAWALGHTTRFHRVVVRDPIIYAPWNPTRSPILFVQNFKVPALILARESDAQAEELYRALKGSAWVRTDGDPAVELEAILAWLGQGAR
jgi:hypothetical protein